MPRARAASGGGRPAATAPCARLRMRIEHAGEPSAPATGRPRSVQQQLARDAARGGAARRSPSPRPVGAFASRPSAASSAPTSMPGGSRVQRATRMRSRTPRSRPGHHAHLRGGAERVGPGRVRGGVRGGSATATVPHTRRRAHRAHAAARPRRPRRAARASGDEAAAGIGGRSTDPTTAISTLRRAATASVTAGAGRGEQPGRERPTATGTVRRVASPRVRSRLERVAQRRQALLADAVHLGQLVDRARSRRGRRGIRRSAPQASGRCRRPRRAAPAVAVERWTCAPGELRPERAAGGRTRSPHRHDDLLAVLHLRGQVHQREIRSPGRSPCPLERRRHPRVRRQPEQARPPYRAGHVHVELAACRAP